MGIVPEASIPPLLLWENINQLSKIDHLVSAFNSSCSFLTFISDCTWYFAKDIFSKWINLSAFLCLAIHFGLDGNLWELLLIFQRNEKLVVTNLCSFQQEMHLRKRAIGGFGKDSPSTESGHHSHMIASWCDWNQCQNSKLSYNFQILNLLQATRSKIWSWCKLWKKMTPPPLMQLQLTSFWNSCPEGRLVPLAQSSYKQSSKKGHTDWDNIEGWQ